MNVARCRCSACGAVLQVRREHVGTKTKCPKCAAEIVLRAEPEAKKLQVAKRLDDEPDGDAPETGLPRIDVEPSPPGDRRPRGTPATEAGVKRHRSLRLPLLVSGVALAALVVVVVVASFLLPPRRKAAEGRQAARPPVSPSATQPEPETTETSEPEQSILVLDWPENERPDSMLLIDGAPRAIPASGKVEFAVEPGGRMVALKRRGYEPIEIAMLFAPGARHHYKPAWQAAAPPTADPEPTPAGATAGMPAEAPSAPPRPGETERAAAEPPTPPTARMEPPPSPEQPAPEPESPPGVEDPERFLAEKGLVASGDSWSLPGESKLNRDLREAQKIWGEITRAQRELAKVQQVVDASDAAMLAFVQRRGELGAMLSNVRTVEDNNRLVGALNDLRAQMVARGRQLEAEEKARDQAAAAVFAKAGEYEQLLIESRRLHGEVKGQYEALAADPQVAEAIRRHNEAHGKEARLGPGVLFAGIDKRLAGLEAKVFSEAISLRKGGGNLWYVPVVFNGQHTQEMAVDTGASVLALSFEQAQAVGLAPGTDAKTVHVQVADGSIVPCKQVFAETVRVGKFTAENVECTVLPLGSPPTTPLLGLSFFKHFNFQIDSAQGRLVMSQIDMEAGDEQPPPRTPR